MVFSIGSNPSAGAREMARSAGVSLEDSFPCSSRVELMRRINPGYATFGGE